jgi:hypothetical protein
MQRYGTIVIVGGGCYGSYYVRQLGRAVAAGALSCERLLVVDRDPECQVARSVREGETRAAPLPTIITRDWGEFFHEYLVEAALRDDAANDAIVPSPLMPHLMYEWLLARARERWPGRAVATRPLDSDPPIPWQKSAPDGTHYVSFAEWVCPINCIEPARCPKTRGPRDWSLPPAVRAYVAAERTRGRNLAGPVIFHCVHRAYGVGMFDTRDVLAGDELVASAAADGPADVLVGTVSHCHGALSVLSIGA